MRDGPLCTQRRRPCTGTNAAAASAPPEPRAPTPPPPAHPHTCTPQPDPLLPSTHSPPSTPPPGPAPCTHLLSSARRSWSHAKSRKRRITSLEGRAYCGRVVRLRTCGAGGRRMGGGGGGGRGGSAGCVASRGGRGRWQQPHAAAHDTRRGGSTRCQAPAPPLPLPPTLLPPLLPPPLLRPHVPASPLLPPRGRRRAPCTRRMPPRPPPASRGPPRRSQSPVAPRRCCCPRRRRRRRRPSRTAAAAPWGRPWRRVWAGGMGECKGAGAGGPRAAALVALGGGAAGPASRCALRVGRGHTPGYRASVAGGGGWCALRRCKRARLAPPRDWHRAWPLTRALGTIRTFLTPPTLTMQTARPPPDQPTPRSSGF